MSETYKDHGHPPGWENEYDPRCQACAQSELASSGGSVPTAAELLERAHDMMARANIMLDGWQQAVDWHHDYERFKAQNDQALPQGGAKETHE